MFLTLTSACEVWSGEISNNAWFLFLLAHKKLVTRVTIKCISHLVFIVSLVTCKSTVHTRRRVGCLSILMMIFPWWERFVSGLVLVICSLIFTGASHAATVTGELFKWHPINIDFIGPFANERDDSPNPFLDYRLTVRLQSPSGQTTKVPGFFAGNGQGAGAGNVWRIRFAADEVGQWQYQATFRRGDDVAVSLDPFFGSDIGISGASGNFYIGPAPANAPPFLRHGRLDYVGEHYLKHRDGPFWIKSGTDSPENLLAYTGFDGTVDQGGVDANFLHDFAAHRGDARDSDPFFTNDDTGADSRGITGALNYLAQQGVNSVYFLPMNLGGDGQDTFPFISGSKDRFSKTHYDISKLHQWDMVFSHAQRQGIALHFVLSETESENEQWLDNGALGIERRLFFRELVARYAYLLGGKWNLGEEVDYPLVELHKHADYIQAIDWSEKPIAAHTHINQFFRYGEIVGDPRFSASSIQYDARFASQFVEQWRNNSRNAGHPWVLDMDENTNGLTNDSAESRRLEVLYDVYFSGGNIEWFFGSHPLPVGGDTTAGDFRFRENMWRSMRIARQFMENELPFWRMQPADELVVNESDRYGGAEVFAARGEVYAIYLPHTNGNAQLNLEGGGRFIQRWFNPETGGFEGGERVLQAGALQPLGAPPSRNGQDWVVLVRASDAPVIENPTPTPTPTPVDEVPPVSEGLAPTFADLGLPPLMPGEFYSASVMATLPNGSAPVVTVGQLPPGMRIQGPGGGVLQLEWQVPADFSGDARVELIAFDGLNPSLRTVQLLDLLADSTTPLPPETPVPQGGENADFPAIAQQTVRVGTMLRLRIAPRARNGLPPALRIDNPPTGAEFPDNGDGTRSLVWTPSAEAVGEVQLDFVADYGDAVLRQSVRINITP